MRMTPSAIARHRTCSSMESSFSHRAITRSSNSIFARIFALANSSAANAEGGFRPALGVKALSVRFNAVP